MSKENILSIKKAVTFTDKLSAGALVLGIVVFLFWPLMITVMFYLPNHLSEDSSIWDTIYAVFFLEGFWLSILGGFVFILWADSKKLFH